ncbi:MAG: hypothetical protein ACLQUY_12170 [Ktedonobacterales bacterium]
MAALPSLENFANVALMAQRHGPAELGAVSCAAAGFAFERRRLRTCRAILADTVVAAEGNNQDAASVARVHRRFPCGRGNWPETLATPQLVGQVPEVAATTRSPALCWMPTP